MRYPNLRYGSPAALEHYAMRYGSTKELARELRRDVRTVSDWLAGKTKIPWWVPEILRLKQMEHAAMVYQMTGRQIAARLGVVTGNSVIDSGHRFRPEDPMPSTVEPAPVWLSAIREKIQAVK